MNRGLSIVSHFVKDEDGPSAVEYAVTLAMVIVICIAIVRLVGNSVSRVFSSVNSNLQ